jgi:chemotaxis signal transduction protein
MVDAGPAAAAERVLVCRSDGERFAIPIALVREVIALPPLSRIPGATARVVGLANVHGTLVTVLSAPILTEDPEPSRATMLVVLNLHRGQVGFAVEEVDDLGTRDASGVRMVEVEAVVRGVLGGS